MKKTIIIELTEEEKNFIKTCPPNPCTECVHMGGCYNWYSGGCEKARDFRKRTEFMEKEVVDLGQTYVRIKDIEREMNKMVEERKELIELLRSYGVEV